MHIVVDRSGIFWLPMQGLRIYNESGKPQKLKSFKWITKLKSVHCVLVHPLMCHTLMCATRSPSLPAFSNKPDKQIVTNDY